MNDREEPRIALEKRIAEQIASVLRLKCPDASPLLRVRIAYAAATAILQRAQQAETVRALEYRLNVIEGGDFEI